MIMREVIKLFSCSIDAETRIRLNAILENGQIASGQSVYNLEKELSKNLRERDVVLIDNMSNAIELTLKLIGVKFGDEVITLSFNCLTSTVPIKQAGAVPIWADIDIDTCQIDLDSVKQLISPKTKAIIVYHFAGYPANILKLRDICDENRLALIEDANTALGAKWHSIPIGTIGDFAILSFYPNRQVNGIEGSAVVCKLPEDAEKLRRLRKLGIEVANFRDKTGEINPKCDIKEMGRNASMNNLNSTIALANLNLLSVRLKQVRTNVEYINKSIKGSRKVKPIDWDLDSEPAFWTFLLRSPFRDHIQKKIRKNGIETTRLHYPNHHYKIFKSSLAKLPRTDELARTLFTVPCGWWLTRKQLDRIINSILE